MKLQYKYCAIPHRLHRIRILLSSRSLASGPTINGHHPDPRMKQIGSSYGPGPRDVLGIFLLDLLAIPTYRFLWYCVQDLPCCLGRPLILGSETTNRLESAKGLCSSLSLSRTDRPRSGRPRAAVTAVRVEKIGEMVGERLRRNLGPHNLEV